MSKPVPRCYGGSGRKGDNNYYKIDQFHAAVPGASAKTFGVLNDWLSDHNSPELQYIETKWASLMSYGMTVDLLKEVLPVNDSLDAETVRHHLHKAAMRQDEQQKDEL